MLRWKRCIILTFISGAAFAAPEINVKQNESLPDLGSQAAQQDEQTNKGKSLKERGADYVINSATQGFENLTPEALKSQARSYLQSQITSTAQSYIEDTLSPYGGPFEPLHWSGRRSGWQFHRLFCSLVR